MEDPNKVVPPSGDLVLIDLRVKDSGGHISLFLLDDFPLDIGYGSAKGASISGSLGVHIVGMAHVRSQLADRAKDRPAERIQPCSFQSPVESLTHFTASPSQVDIISIICHRVLGGVSHKFVFA